MVTAAATLKEKAHNIRRDSAPAIRPHVKTMASNNGGKGRPRLIVDMEAVRKLASIQCTVEECAAVLGINEQTLRAQPDFLYHFNSAKCWGTKSLRRKIWRTAMGIKGRKGHPGLMLWLSKQHLGMHEPGQKVELATSGGVDVQHTHTFQIEPEQFQAAVAILAEAGALRTLPAGVVGTGKKIIDVESGSE